MIKSAYIHIPFCTTICSYCDFPKVYKNNVLKYLNALEKEIQKNYKGEILDTLYIGGGTPSSLDVNELEILFSILSNLKLSQNCEITMECNLENISQEKLICMKDFGVNRLSFGIQTFHEKYLKLLNRKTCDVHMIQKSKELGFSNINVDLIYAIPNETLDELKSDLEQFLKLDIDHISTYSLMIEKHTDLYRKKILPIDEELDEKMYLTICDILKNHGYEHYEISNFARNQKYSQHNLTYWNNEYYYGFGMGASGYVNQCRYTNTSSITHYIDGQFLKEEEKIDKKLQMEYEMILGLRKIKGVSYQTFKEKYQSEIDEVFDIKKNLNERKLIKDNGYLKINPQYLYVSNEILINFVGEE